ncbi:ATP12-domain-containing protein [Exidia glandulosa HHB12029]|uniref:ATP12-domain-containing protein n=1 Tax=Exidia glandulosa HHB12029 TaxID=1314781 RepID=A0A165I3F5_EXIGL|nr:ATP12-domain-containing protein [Exidia glandulosa HHB12029]
MATVQQPDGPSDAKKAEITLKRFWKAADVEEKPDAFFVTLDKRPLKTPGGKRLEIPKSKRLLATLVAYEWDNQEKLIKPHALPLTSLAARALDDLTNEQNRAEVCAALIKYLDTDSICFHGDEPEGLVKLQNAHWDPIIDWARKEFDVELTVFTGLFGSSQPAETKAKLAKVLEDMDAWQLAGLERAVYASKSLIVALALVRGRITPEEAAQAAHVEVLSQIQRWGEVEDSHDVDHQDIRRQLGSVVCLLANV